jgi:hypothetical protein
MAKWPVDRSPKRRVSAKLVAVVWILFLELLVATYVYTTAAGGQSQTAITFPTTSTKTTTTSTTSKTSTTTTTTSKISDKITVVAASIANDTLSMLVHNLGPSSTELLTLESLCTPKFQTCYGYAAMARSAYKSTFVLPAKKSFLDNLTGICVIAIPSCKGYLPINGSTYYYEVQFTFADGSNVVVPVTAEANNTWSPYPTAILGIGSAALPIYSSNLTATLSATITANDSLPYASWTTSLDGYTKAGSAFSGPILTNETGCEGSPVAPVSTFSVPRGALNFTASCSSPVGVVMGFTSVLTGIAPGPYFAVVVRDTTDIDRPSGLPNYDAYPYFAFAEWVQATKG